MRIEHEQANRLIDIAETGDRQAYRAKLESLRAEHSENRATQIANLARVQIKMRQDYRLFAWRAEWIAERKG